MIATPASEGEFLPAPRPLLLSLRPRFAQAILDGTKTVELRRTRVSAPPGTLLVIYSSSPVMAVVGVATLADRDTASPATIWRRYRSQLGLSQAEFSDYFAGAEQATALSIAAPRTLPTPLTLARLRAHSAFQPPQSYRYIAPTDPSPLTELAVAWAG
ncbi:ASCH domain-containing protein [Saccharothrix texasensis]|uniref:Putative transcriptional regulator n=1 Tax=Saccharothrix texasensis TaxID=103734 RepID=A0A3N1H4R7_9PSEU|nr:ASCH domain-containing protein [Saccharothrix texasensis]ROP37212.1 putative transcriptional regulator [Saccharothrix texasensis]